MIDKRILRQLSAVDWDFPASLRGLSNAIHWYPGTFPSQLPATFVQALSGVNGLVLDPYSGIGTTGVESLRLGRKAWAVDLNPIASLASYVHGGLVLLAATSPDLFALALDSVEADLISFREYSVESGATFNFQLADRSDIELAVNLLIRPSPEEFFSDILRRKQPSWELLGEWIDEKGLSVIERIFKFIHRKDGLYFHKLIMLMLISSIAKPVSSQTRSWGHIADNVKPTEFVYKSAVQYAVNGLRRMRNSLNKMTVMPLKGGDGKKVRYWVSTYDWTSNERVYPKPRNKADLLVTSPPYGGAIDYSLSQRLSFYLLGYTEKELLMTCSKEIGARRKRFKQNSRDAWADDISRALQQQIKSMKEDGVIVYVMPHKEAGRQNGLAVIDETMSQLGWGPAFSTDRSIRQLRARQSWTSIKKETITIYVRD